MFCPDEFHFNDILWLIGKQRSRNEKEEKKSYQELLNLAIDNFLATVVKTRDTAVAKIEIKSMHFAIKQCLRV